MRRRDIAAKAQELWEYEFTDGRVTKKPIVILGPDGTNRNMLRVYAYGGLIGRIAAEEKRDDSHHLASLDYAKYLEEADAEYVQYMFKKYPDMEKMPEKSPGEKLSGRLHTILEQNNADKSGMLFEAEYLDLILKAAKIRFTGKQTGKPQERKIEAAIVKKHMRKETEDGWCIIDAEYDTRKGTKTEGADKPDLVVYDRQKGFGFIELKYENNSTENKCKHYQAVHNMIENTGCEEIIKELKRRCRFLADYELVNREFFDCMENDSHSCLWQGFLFVGGNKSDSVRQAKDMARQCKDIAENDNCLFWWYPYIDDSSLDNIDLRYSSKHTYKEFVKEHSGSDHS